MTSHLDQLFSAADRRAIADAVDRAERGSAGEVVPVVVAASDEYEVAAWKGAALTALASAVVAAAAHELLGIWGHAGLWILLATAAGALAGFLLAGWLAGPRRWLIGAVALEREVEQRAREAFLTHEVFRTRDRTGILIFVSLFERRVMVLADEGIHRLVPEQAWNGLVADLVAAIRRGEASAGLVGAVERCGELLRSHRVEARADDRDELPDELHLSER